MLHLRDLIKVMKIFDFPVIPKTYVPKRLAEVGCGKFHRFILSLDKQCEVNKNTNSML